LKNVRAIAARAVARVMRGRSLDDVLLQAPQVPPRDRALLQAMVYGVIRDYRLLGALVDAMSDRAIDNDEVDALLRVGLYQLRSMRVPAHAAVQETVEATTILNQPRPRALINALLRRYQREQAQLEEALVQSPGIVHSHPDWLVRRIEADWGAAAESVIAANQQAGPMTLRVNGRRMSGEAYRARLAAQGLDAHTVPGVPEALVLEQPQAVEAIPGFTRGSASVQDASAQLAAALLDAQPGQRVLDACAAPGGKTAHILERCPDAHVVALDADKQRLIRIDESLRRLRLSAQVVAGDAAQPEQWWDGTAFERILIDAPCSATGVIRRHPDIKWLRREDDVERLAQGQLRMLKALWPLLAPGGVLVYATCSILDAEGAAVAEHFMACTADAQEFPIEAEWGVPARLGRRLAPGGDFDGFYYLRLRKAESAEAASSK